MLIFDQEGKVIACEELYTVIIADISFIVFKEKS